MLGSMAMEVATKMSDSRCSGKETDAEEEIRLERDAWIHEARRFLLSSVNAAIEVALHELERVDFLWGRIRLGKLTTTPAIKVDLRVEGHLVVAADITLKLGRQARTHSGVTGTLQQYCVLNQILEFHGVMHAQLKRLQALQKFLLGEQGELQAPAMPAHDQANQVAYLMDVVRKTAEEVSLVCGDLRRAVNVLRLPSQRRFPYSAYVDHSFKPELPPDVAVDFSIHRGELLMEAFGLALTSKSGGTKLPDGCCTKEEFVGRTCWSRGQHVEIVDYASVTVAIPQIDEMLNHTDEQIAGLVHVRDNARALLGCHQA